MKQKILLVVVMAAALFIPSFAKAQALDDLTITIGNKLLVYPNPVLSDTRIVLPEESFEPVFVAVLNMSSGRIEFTNKYAPGTNMLYLDMSTLPVGMYNVQVSGADITTTRLKIIKQ